MTPAARAASSDGLAALTSSSEWVTFLTFTATISISLEADVMGEGETHTEPPAGGRGRRFGRRGLLAGGVGAVLATLVGRVKRAEAATDDALILGHVNEAGDPTGLKFSGEGSVLVIENVEGAGITISGNDAAVGGLSLGGPGIVGAALSEQPDRKSTRLNSSHIQKSRMPSSA